MPHHLILRREVQASMSHQMPTQMLETREETLTLRTTSHRAVISIQIAYMTFRANLALTVPEVQLKPQES